MSSVSAEEFARMLAEMRDAYLAELPQRLEGIEALMLDVDRTDDFADLYETLYREVHSIKGSAGTHGLHAISTVCHNLEDCLAEVSAEQSKITQDHKNNWLAYLDLLVKTSEKYQQGEEDFADIEDEIDKLRHTSPGVKYRALMIEPSGMHAQMCEKVLSKYGVSFSYASDGYEALGRLLSEPFDILVTSLQIPRLDGQALIGALRLGSKRNREMKTILLTSRKMHYTNRQIDPDYIVEKNSRMLENLQRIANEITPAATS